MVLWTTEKAYKATQTRKAVYIAKNAYFDTIKGIKMLNSIHLWLILKNNCVKKGAKFIKATSSS